MSVPDGEPGGNSAPGPPGGRTQVLPGGGLPLGIFPDAEPATREIGLDPGARGTRGGDAGRGRSLAAVAHGDDLLSPEPEPEPEHLPAIPASAGAMIFDRAGRLLILKPTYKSGWTIPGGVMEADGETPWEACQREVREECGLEVRTGRLACVDFRRPRPGRPGGMRFLFDCGAFGDASLGAVVLQPEEISEHRFVPLPAALDLLRGPVRRRVKAAAGAKAVVYLEEGRPVPGVGP